MTLIEVRLNARLQPLDRGSIYEDPLLEFFHARGHGSDVVGGGTLMETNGEPRACDIELSLGASADVDAETILIIGLLESLGAPKGSFIRLVDLASDSEAEPVSFGVTEGLGLYLNGIDLPRHVYDDFDVNDLIDLLNERLGGVGRMHSFWKGPHETALYFYGASASRMSELMQDVLQSNPLAQQSRLVPLMAT